MSRRDYCGPHHLCWLPSKGQQRESDGTSERCCVNSGQINGKLMQQMESSMDLMMLSLQINWNIFCGVDIQEYRVYKLQLLKAQNRLDENE